MDDMIELPGRPLLVIRPTSGWAALNLPEIWRYRDLLFTLASRDVKLRYRQTALGVIWVVLQPLLAAGIFSFVFGKVAHLPSDGVPYFLFSYAGLLAWNAFSSTLGKASTCLIQNSQLISKVFFPRLIVPLSTVFSSLIDFGVALAMMVVMLAYSRLAPGLTILLLPVWLLLILMLAAGCGLFAAALTVSYRDVQFVLPVLLQFAMYASPIAYSASAVPARWRLFYYLNPLSGLLEAFRCSLLGRGAVAWWAVAYGAAWAVAALIAGAFAFKRMERRFADVI
jgi:lipopolysaccharide transport system permease protein